MVISFGFGINEIRMEHYFSYQTVFVDDIFEVNLVFEALNQLSLIDGIIAVRFHQLLQSSLELINIDLLERKVEFEVSDEPCL